MVKSRPKHKKKIVFAGFSGKHSNLKLEDGPVSERIRRLMKTARNPDPKKAGLREEAIKQLARLKNKTKNSIRK